VEVKPDTSELRAQTLEWFRGRLESFCELNDAMGIIYTVEYLTGKGVDIKELGLSPFDEKCVTNVSTGKLYL
jgi:hypothetical protein